MRQKLDDSLDRRPVTIKVRKGQRDRLRLVPDWQDKLRAKIDEIIEENLACAVVLPITSWGLGWLLKYVAIGLPYFGLAIGVIYMIAAIVKVIRRLSDVGH